MISKYHKLLNKFFGEQLYLTSQHNVTYWSVVMCIRIYSYVAVCLDVGNLSDPFTHAGHPGEHD